METEIKTEGEVDTTNNETVEETQDEGDFVKVPKKDYDTLNQTLGSLKRELKGFKKPKETSEDKSTTETKDSNDLGEKAYLIANGIKTADEMAFVKKMKKETGKDIESLLETTYFQAEFKDFKEKKATANAIPTASQRSNNSSIDTVEYWIAKGELPPASEVELRRKVVNARMKKEEAKGIFYNA